MSEAGQNDAARAATEAKPLSTEDANKAKGAAGENPQREWIDTLLMAAVMTRSKKKSTEGEATAANGEAKTAESVAPTEAAPAVERDGGDKSQSNSNEDVSIGEEQTADTARKSVLGNEGSDSHLEDEKRYRRRRCEVPGCTKFARFNNACSGHGGRRLCSQSGCKRVAQFGHKCSAHGGVKYCSVDGCKRAVQSRGFCKTHGGGVRCKHPGCEKGAISKGHCRAHGGGSRCAEESCQKWAQRHGFCVRHSKAAAGSGEETPAVDSAQV